MMLPLVDAAVTCSALLFADADLDLAEKDAAPGGVLFRVASTACKAAAIKCTAFALFFLLLLCLLPLDVVLRGVVLLLAAAGGVVGCSTMGCCSGGRY